MAKAQIGCLGWIIVAGAAIAWLSGGFEDRTVITSVPIVTSSPTFSSSQIASSPAPRVAPDTTPPPVAVPITREASIPAAPPVAPQANVPPRREAPGRAMSTTANVRLRASEKADAPIVTTLRKGTEVEVVGSAGDRLQVNVPSLNVTGWVHRSYLADSSPSMRSAPAFAATQQAAPKPKASAPRAKPQPPKPAPGTPIRDPVYGSCDCPYDYARNGSHCGGRSAYSRPGGRAPVCYYE